MLNIHISTIPDTEQRYDTVGDYQSKKDGSQLVTVSDMSDPRYEFLIALHEIVESYLCKQRGITDEAIDAFDMEFEAKRADDDLTSEPGNQEDAPYHKEHVFATKIERLMADELGVSWEEYAKACAALTNNDE